MILESVVIDASIASFDLGITYVDWDEQLVASLLCELVVTVFAFIHFVDVRVLL